MDRSTTPLLDPYNGPEDEEICPRSTEDVARSVQAELAVAALTGWQSDPQKLLHYLRARGHALVMGLLPSRMFDYTIWLRRSAVPLDTIIRAYERVRADLAVLHPALHRLARRAMLYEYAVRRHQDTRILGDIWSSRQRRLLKLYVPTLVQIQFTHLASDLLSLGWADLGGSYLWPSDGQGTCSSLPLTACVTEVTSMAKHLPRLPPHLSEIIEHMDPQWRAQFTCYL